MLHRTRWLGLIALALTLLPAAQASGRPGQPLIFQSPRELASDDAAARARTLDQIRDLGAGWLRVSLYWHDVAPDANSATAPAFDERDPASYSWTRYDRVIDEARQRGLRVLLTVGGPVPRWATRDKRDTVSYPSARRFERFVTAVGRRYASRIGMWSIWNEPNHPGFLGPQYVGHGARRHPASPAIYRRLFRAGRAGLRASGAGPRACVMGRPPRTDPLFGSHRCACCAAHWSRQALQAPSGRQAPRRRRVGPTILPPAPPALVKPRDRDDVTIGAVETDNALDRSARAGVIGRRTVILRHRVGV